MASAKQPELSRREREIMNVIYARGAATAAEVADELHDNPSGSTVRTLLRILEEKGHLKHKQDGPRYVYSPTRPRHVEGRSALRRVMQTFYRGSVEKTVMALLDAADTDLSDDEARRIEAIIQDAKRKGESS